jgi:hypothetical protein
MRVRGRIPWVAATAAVVVGALGATPAEASRKSCLKEAGGAKVVAESKSSLAYARGGKLHACVYSADHSVLLPLQGKRKVGGDKGFASINRRHLSLAGRYVAYSWSWIKPAASAHPPTVTRVYVYDARDAKVKHRGKDHGEGEVGALFLKPHGSVAWTFAPSSTSASIVEVLKIDKTGSGEQELDVGSSDSGPYSIDPGSLALSGDRTRLYWTRDPGGVQSAPIK